MSEIALIETFTRGVDSLRKKSRKGAEYWLARELQAPLGYETWENFEKVIHRAKMACEASGVDSKNQFLETTKMVDIGSGAKRARGEWYLSRYACYLVAMNGDPQKAEVALAQTYFAVQTRRQEQDDAGLSQRFELREKVKSANRDLNDVAKSAGVQSYGLFHDAGYRALYQLSLSAIKKRKGLDAKEDLLDRSGRAELAANLFRITQTEQKIVRESILGESNAIAAHRSVGREVRATIAKIGGTMPEDLPPEPSIEKLQRAQVAAITNPKT